MANYNVKRYSSASVRAIVGIDRLELRDPAAFAAIRVE
jgi:hypothetical protein